MQKSLYDHLNEFGYTNPRIVTSTLKALAYSGVTDIDTLMKMKPEEIQKIKGIGPTAMSLISKVMTKEQMTRDRKMAEYKRQCREVKCTCLRDWFQKAGWSYLSASKLEKIMRRNSVKSIDDFMKTELMEFESFNGVGEKSLEVIEKTKGLIKRDRRRQERKKADLAEHCFA